MLGAIHSDTLDMNLAMRPKFVQGPAARENARPAHPAFVRKRYGGAQNGSSGLAPADCENRNGMGRLPPPPGVTPQGPLARLTEAPPIRADHFFEGGVSLALPLSFLHMMASLELISKRYRCRECKRDVF